MEWNRLDPSCLACIKFSLSTKTSNLDKYMCSIIVHRELVRLIGLYEEGK